jgi:hypothetical protein
MEWRCPAGRLRRQGRGTRVVGDRCSKALSGRIVVRFRRLRAAACQVALELGEPGVDGGRIGPVAHEFALATGLTRLPRRRADSCSEVVDWPRPQRSAIRRRLEVAS